MCSKCVDNISAIELEWHKDSLDTKKEKKTAMNNVIYDDFQDWLYNPHNPINSVHQGGFPNMGGPPMISPPHSLPPQHRESMDTSFEEPMQVSTTGDTYMDCDSSEVGQTRSNGHIYMHATDGSWYYMYRYQLSNNNVHYTSNS